MNKKIIRIAHEFPQAEMFQLTRSKESPWVRSYVNQMGDMYAVSAPASPGVREMVVFLGGIWFTQHPESALEFRELGNIIIKKLNRQDSLAIFIVDASNLNKGSDFVMSVLLSLATKFHLEIDVIMILNKVDLVGEKISKFMNIFFDDPDAFVNEMLRDNTGILGELSFDLVDILRQYLPPTRIVSVSAKKKIGFNDLYSIINDALCECGDLR